MGASHHRKLHPRKKFNLGEEVEPAFGGDWSSSTIKEIISNHLVVLENGKEIATSKIRRITR